MAGADTSTMQHVQGICSLSFKRKLIYDDVIEMSVYHPQVECPKPKTKKAYTQILQKASER